MRKTRTTKFLANLRFQQQTVPQQLAEFLKSELLPNHKAGEFLPSLNELTQQYQVSRMTLRSAISILAQQGFVDIWHGSGTYVSDVTGRKHLALVVNSDISLPNTSSYWMQTTQRLRFLLH